MIIFPFVMFGRDGVDRTLVTYLAMTLGASGSPPNGKTAVSAFSSVDGLSFKQRNIRGDLPDLASKGQFYLPPTGPAVAVRNGRIFFVFKYFDTDPNNSKAVLVTTDDGWNFKVRSHPFTAAAFNRGFAGIVVFGTKIVALLETGECIISSDNGDTWVTGAASGLTFVRTIAANATAIIAGGDAGSLVSTTNPAVSWAAQTSQFGTSLVTASAASSTGFVISGSQGKISTGNAAGTAFTARSSGVTSYLDKLFLTGTHWFAAALDAWITSADGGVSWATADPYWTTTQDVLRTQVEGSGKSLIFHGAGGLAVSTDHINWDQAPTPGLGTSDIRLAAYRLA